MDKYNLLKLSTIIYIIVNTVILNTPANAYDNSKLEISISFNKDIYAIGETVVVECIIYNSSSTTLWLPPLQIVDTHFKLYDGYNELIPFELPAMARYGPNEQQFIKLAPGQCHVLKRVLNRDSYKIPVLTGQYRLCVLYENDKHSMQDIDLWVGKIRSCVLLKIK